MRDPVEFKEQAEKVGITRWEFRGCSMCDYPLNFQFINGKVYVDTGCYCVTYSTPLTEVSWETVASFYNQQTNLEAIQKMDIFWNFDGQ